MTKITRQESFLFLKFLLFQLFTLSMPYPTAQGTTKYWMNGGQTTLRLNLQKQLQLNQAKNVILFLGDGFGIAPVTASRIYRGQTENLTSEQTPFSWETFPFAGLSKTYDADYHVTDSASSATAFLCGTKANYYTLGVGPEVKLYDCPASLQHPVKSIMQWAVEAGKEEKWAGFVTTTRLTSATPAAGYAHSAYRYWEDDNLMKQRAHGADVSKCKDIARQLVELSPGNKLKVVLAGGRKHMTPNTTLDPEPDYANQWRSQYGGRTDGRNLINEWLNLTGNRQYVWNRTQLNSVDPNKIDNLMGLFEYNDMDYQLLYEHSKRTDNPTIEEMTTKAIQVLKKSPNGYFLLVEGGNIDNALHEARAKMSMEEARWFHKAVLAGTKLTSSKDTLLVVTADHSHTLTVVGYPKRNVSILGTFNDQMADNKVISILNFASGNSSLTRMKNGNQPRRNLTGVDTTADKFIQPAFMPRLYETHGGEDVGVWAKGPFSHLFTGTMENNYIAHAMAFAMCVGPSQPVCSSQTSTSAPVTPAPPTPKNYMPMLIVAVVLAALCLVGLIIVSCFQYRLLKKRAAIGGKTYEMPRQTE